MSVGSDFADTVRVCEFYSRGGLPVEVDYENYYVNLDSYLQSVLTDWREEF